PGAFRRRADMGGAGGGEELEAEIGLALVGVVRREAAQGPWAPPGLLERLAGRRFLGRLALVDTAGGYLPPPRVGGEAMAVEQQHAAVVIVHHRPRRGRRRPH